MYRHRLGQCDVMRAETGGRVCTRRLRQLFQMLQNRRQQREQHCQAIGVDDHQDHTTSSVYRMLPVCFLINTMRDGSDALVAALRAYFSLLCKVSRVDGFMQERDGEIVLTTLGQGSF